MATATFAAKKQRYMIGFAGQVKFAVAEGPASALAAMRARLLKDHAIAGTEPHEALATQLAFDKAASCKESLRY